MDIRVRKSQLEGRILVPGSKSHTIRAVAIASAADGVSLIRAPLVSEDTIACAEAVSSMGAGVHIESGLWTVKGVSGRYKPSVGMIDLRNSGTSLRILSGLAAVAGCPACFDGDSSLRTRPMKPLIDALVSLGAEIESRDDGFCPIKIVRPALGGNVSMECRSSQFLSSLLIALPLAPRDSFIKALSLNEKPYVEMTLGWLQKQGIQLEYPDDLSCFHIRGNQSYAAFDQVIPADFSTASFPLVAAALTQGKVQIENLDFSDMQGDKAVFEYIELMGATVEKCERYTNVSSDGALLGQDFDLNSTPDALPALAVAASLAKGTTRLLNCPQARIKETDRIRCMACELRKMGADIEELPDGMVIRGGALKGCTVDGHGDHRIVMALAIAGMVAENETVVKGSEAAAVTYPSFVEDFLRLGAHIVEE
ncbi:MAG: 3-phosphoshikimate 1-carboxyvinyltransferase [Victivallales bacterium]|nr:3-phosphoshikimate 1-carboxyvinyltransferase [Victivallales bacterium]